MKNNKNMLFLMLPIIILIIPIVFMVKGSSEKESRLLIGSTTSLQDSGLLDELLQEFYKETGIDVKVIAVGTGQAMKLGEDGEVDVLLVHDKPSEIKFVKEGHGTKRWDVMYNDFILVGSKQDPLSLKKKAKADIKEAFREIAFNQTGFVSRGDQSGTHKKEMTIWKEVSIEPSYKGYISAGKGMGDVLKMADELRAYTLTDRGTYLKFSKQLELDVIVEQDKNLINMYGVVAVNPKKNQAINSKGAQIFIKWLLSPEIQKRIGQYGIDKNGRPLFTPCAEVY